MPSEDTKEFRTKMLAALTEVQTDIKAMKADIEALKAKPAADDDDED